MTGKMIEPEQKHHDFKVALVEFMQKNAEMITAEEQLAVAAQVVGMMIALQDGTKHTVSEVMKMVQFNIMQGNEVVSDQTGPVN